MSRSQNIHFVCDLCTTVTSLLLLLQLRNWRVMSWKEMGVETRGGIKDGDSSKR
jgi:hypothetical protein